MERRYENTQSFAGKEIHATHHKAYYVPLQIQLLRAGRLQLTVKLQKRVLHFTLAFNLIRTVGLYRRK